MAAWLDLLDIFLMSAEGLRERKFRVALNVIGILIGVAAVTGLVSLTQGLNEEITEQLELFGPSNLMIVPGHIQRGRGYVGYTLGWRELELIEKTAHVELTAPIVGNKVGVYTVRGEDYFTNVFGVTPDYFTIFRSYKLEEGRSIRRNDNAVAVVGHTVANPQDRDEAVMEVGDRIRLQVTAHGEEREMVFRVVGILKEVGGTFGSEDDQSILIPLRVCQQLYGVGGEYDFIAASVDSGDRVDEVKEKIEDRLGESVMVMSYESVQVLIGDVLGTVEAVLGGIAGISLLVAGVGIVNTMIISVMERTKEIGVLKALGAKSRDVLLMFLSEALITGLLGGVTGALFGFTLSSIVGNIIGLPVSASANIGIAVVAFAIVTSTLSGLYPAWRASNMNPVDALRYG